jgi:hypothetical protein
LAQDYRKKKHGKDDMLGYTILQNQGILTVKKTET